MVMVIPLSGCNTNMVKTVAKIDNDKLTEAYLMVSHVNECKYWPNLRTGLEKRHKFIKFVDEGLKEAREDGVDEDLIESYKRLVDYSSDDLTDCVSAFYGKEFLKIDYRNRQIISVIKLNSEQSGGSCGKSFNNSKNLVLKLITKHRIVGEQGRDGYGNEALKLDAVVYLQDELLFSLKKYFPNCI
jgi:hypothetical protein